MDSIELDTTFDLGEYPYFEGELTALIEAALNLSLFSKKHQQLMGKKDVSREMRQRKAEEAWRENQLVPDLGIEVILRIIFYVVIFVVSLVGNVLVIVTLSLNRRMKTVTNAFLVNLAVSDLLIIIFCMPVTLTGSILRNFIFGETMCKLIPYAQAVSVSVSVWTLVAISLERFFAICRPLHSRQWQTLSHSYKVIWVIWIISSLHTLPILVLTKLMPLAYQKGRHRCREEWPNFESEMAYNVYLDFSMLIIPLTIMTVVYSLLMRKVCASIEVEGRENCDSHQIFHRINIRLKKGKNTNVSERTSTSSLTSNHVDGEEANFRIKNRPCRTLLVQRNYGKSRRARKRVILMLTIVVVEFFVCWTPLYVAYTWHVYSPENVKHMIGPRTFSILQLIAFVSCCSNPITYCFLHLKFREAFLTVVKCRRKKRWQSGRETNVNRSINLNSIYSLKTLSVQIEPAEIASLDVDKRTKKN